MSDLPPLFLERLKQIIPPQHRESVLRTFEQEKTFGLRINTLKTSKEEVIKNFQAQGVEFSPCDWYQDALFLNGKSRELIEPLLKQGHIYLQSPSSMLTVCLFDPQPDERILDMCAAPGSKTSQMASLMRNTGQIVCIEPIKSRYYQLKAVCALLGVQNASFKMIDGRRFRAEELFDKVLVDAPCSCEARFQKSNPKTYGFWSARKIKEMRKKQKGLLLNASRALRPGGVLLYATCTFAPEENEEVVGWVLRKSDGKLKLTPVDLKDVKIYPSPKGWGKKTFNPQVRHGVRILPDERMEGFFVAKFIKC